MIKSPIVEKCLQGLEVDVLRKIAEFSSIKILITKQISDINDRVRIGDEIVCFVEFTPNGTIVDENGFNTNPMKQYRIFESKVYKNEYIDYVTDPSDNWNYIIEKTANQRDQAYALGFKINGVFIVDGKEFKTIKDVEDYFIEGIDMPYKNRFSESSRIKE